MNLTARPRKQKKKQVSIPKNGVAIVSDEFS